MKTAVVTGVTGQDGAYLTKLLLDKGYKVYGAIRRLSSKNLWRLKELGINEDKNFELVDFELTDPASAIKLVANCKPDEIYNLAAQSFVGVSFSQAYSTAQITGIGALNLLEAIKLINKDIKYYQASTSEMFGKVQKIPQDENTPFYPRSPYGVAKLYAHWITVNYRESYNMFATSGILFNHESPLRGLEFVTRKISHAVAAIYLNKQEVLEMGNLNSKRDWGYAGEYVEGMWRMLQNTHPDTYVLATNRTTTVRDFVKKAFNIIDIDLEFDGELDNEFGYDKKTGRKLVRVNPKFYRPAEVDLLIGDASKAFDELGWKANVQLDELCKMMVLADIERIKSSKDMF